MPRKKTIYSKKLVYYNDIDFSTYSGYQSKYEDKYRWFHHSLVARYMLINRTGNKTISINRNILVKYLGNAGVTSDIFNFFKAHFITKQSNHINYGSNKASAKYSINDILLSNIKRKLVANRSINSINKKQYDILQAALTNEQKLEYEYVMSSHMNVAVAIDSLYIALSKCVNISKDMFIRKIEERGCVNITYLHTNLSRTFSTSLDKIFTNTNTPEDKLNKAIDLALDVYHYNDSTMFSHGHNSKRVFHKYNTIKRELRQFVNFDKDYIELDIKCSQPTMLIHEFHDVIPVTEKTLFINDLNKDIYDTLIAVSGLDISREECKKLTFMVLYDKANIIGKYIYNKLNGVFKNRYPYLYAAMEKTKEKNSNALSNILQRKESAIINKFRRACIDNGVEFLTIHDSIAISKEHEEYMKPILQDILNIETNNIGKLK